MKRKTKILAILTGVLVGAISCWFNPYSEMTLLGVPIWMLMSGGALIGAFLITILRGGSPWTNALFVSLGIILAVISRIVYDVTFWDPTSHNLAPFEVIYFGFIAVCSSSIGAFLASLTKRYKELKLNSHES